MREVVSGVVGGVVGSLVTSRLMKISTIKIVSKKEITGKTQLAPSETKTLKPPTQYGFAIVLFHGDGDPEVRLTVKVGNTIAELAGDEQAIELVAGETIEITATNTDPSTVKYSPTIEIAYISW